jgi:hypothetical protein
MIRVLTLAVVALLASDAKAQRFRPMDQPKAAASPACTCTNCQCGAAAKVVPAIPAPPVVTPLPTTRAAVGHTHTCRNGHTWDHSENPTHNCRICGAFQNVQDRTPRPVTVTRAVQSAPPVIRAAPVTIRLPQTSGCANGNCASPYSFR